MIDNKVDLLKNYLPDSVKDIKFTQLNLDVTDLSVTDILRNLNKLYPNNSRTRMSLQDGECAIGILCRAESLEPYNGLFIVVGKKDLEVKFVSCNYIIMYISEDRINTEKDLSALTDEFTDFLITRYSKEMSNLKDFYRKFIYNESELYENDDYTSVEY